jgi:hypothetical protein
MQLVPVVAASLHIRKQTLSPWTIFRLTVWQHFWVLHQPTYTARLEIQGPLKNTLLLVFAPYSLVVIYPRVYWTFEIQVQTKQLLSIVSLMPHTSLLFNPEYGGGKVVSKRHKIISDYTVLNRRRWFTQSPAWEG